MLAVSRSSFALAFKDIQDGICSIHIWPMLGWQDIKQRYRRSIIGPFWLTLSYGALMAGMGPLYGRLFQLDLSTYLPYLATGFVIWLLLSGIITDACNTFIGAEGYIKQIKLPLTVHVLRMIWKNLLIFAHNFVIVLIVMLYFQPSLDLSVLLVPLALLMAAVNGVWAGLLLGLLCARFRDVPQIVTSALQIALFLTPIMFKADTLGRYVWTAHWNPIFHFLEIARGPLIGEGARPDSWIAVLVITCIGYTVTFLMFSRFRARIAYWV